MNKKIYAIATRTRKGTLRRVPDTRFDTEESARRYGEKYHRGKSGEKFYEVIEHPDSKKRKLEEISIAKASNYIIDSGQNMMKQYEKRKKMREKGTQNSAEYKDTDRKLDNRTNGMRRATDNINKKIGMTEDWQKVNRQDKTDGLSQKAVNAYRRENPGSKLKTAVTEKNPTGKRAARRKSFCSRMSGMKARLTSAKTARDPDSRINKALRRWNCHEEVINEISKKERIKYAIRAVGQQKRIAKELRPDEVESDKTYQKRKRGMNRFFRKESTNEACWDGYKMEGMKKKGNRTVPNCVKVEENDPCWKGYEMIGMKKKKGRPVPNCVKTEEAGGMSVGAGLIAGMGGSANGPGTGDSKMSAFKREPGVSKKNQAKHGILRRKAPNPISETVHNRGGTIAAPKIGRKRTLHDRMAAYDKKPKSIRDIERGAFASLNVPPNLHPSKAKQEIERIRRKSSEATYGKDYPSDILPVRSEESESDNAQYGSNVTINGKNMGRMNDPNNPNKSAIDDARQSVRNAFGKNDKSDSSSSRPGAEVQRYPDKNWEESYEMTEKTFAGATVFEVSSSTFHNAKMEKRKGKHWRTYLDECDELSEIREYANKNPGKPIVLQNRTTTEMVYVRYGKKQ